MTKKLQGKRIQLQIHFWEANVREVSISEHILHRKKLTKPKHFQYEKHKGQKNPCFSWQ